MAEFHIDDTVDITDVVCPVTFVKAKVALEELDDGQILSIHMNDGEPVQNVPRSIKEEGHKILKLLQNEDGTYDLIFQKEVLEADGLVLADFYSDSCVPCKRLAPVLAELEETYGDALKVVKVNINFDLPLAEKCEVTAAPTLIFFKNGAEQDRRRGLVKKAELTEIVENLK